MIEESDKGMKYNKLKQKWVLEKTRRKKRSKEIKSVVIKQGVPVFKKFRIRKVVLFGSILDGRAGMKSDVDLLVLPLSKDQFWECRHEIEQAIEYSVDLYTQDDDSHFTEKIMRRGEVIYEV